MNEVTTELGMRVPVLPVETYREHTAERWRERDPSSLDYCIHLIRSLGIVNRSELVRLVDEHRAARGVQGVSRNSIIALINDPDIFKPGEINEIIARSSALLAMESIGAARDLVEKAQSTKDLGAVAMTLTSAHAVKQLSSGGPTEIKEHRHRFSLEDFEAARAGRLAGTGGGVVVDVLTEAVPAADSQAKFEKCNVQNQ